MFPVLGIGTKILVLQYEDQTLLLNIKTKID